MANPSGQESGRETELEARLDCMPRPFLRRKRKEVSCLPEIVKIKDRKPRMGKIQNEDRRNTL